MPTFSSGKVAVLLQMTEPRKEPDVPEASRITVHAAVSRFSVLYEKIRTAVDYKDDHLLRKAAISRILKRRLALYDVQQLLRLGEDEPADLALDVIRELIAARYLPNATLSETLVPQAALIIQKYIALRRADVAGEPHYRWLLGIIAAELEETLVNHDREKALVHFLFEQLGDRIVFRGATITDEERRLLVYTACYRSLNKADEEMLGYKLTRVFHAAWVHPETWLHDPRDLALQMVGVERKVKDELAHPLLQKLTQAVKPWAVALGMIRDALVEDPARASALMEHPDALHAALYRIAERRAKASRGKLRRGIFRAVIYLFMTKMLLALAIEIPFEKILYGEIFRLSLAVNVFFPPVLIFFIGSLIRMPGKENILRIQELADELLSVEGAKGRELRIRSRRGIASRLWLGIAYAATFLLSFGLVYLGLRLLHFTWLSSSIFLFFLCIVSFFAFRLRLSAREYVVVSVGDRFRNVLIDFFSLPILRAGQLLSSSISRVNIFIFIFDFIIETPFKLILNVLEEWFAFLKEKKDELQ